MSAKLLAFLPFLWYLPFLSVLPCLQFLDFLLSGISCRSAMPTVPGALPLAPRPVRNESAPRRHKGAGGRDDQRETAQRA
jgi:hypothetical protein